MNKSYYRDLFVELKPFLKLSTFCQMIGLSKSTLSMFMKDQAYDYMISLETLQRLHACIMDFMNNFA